MGAKTDIVSWGVIIGGVALLGYAGLRGIQTFLPTLGNLPLGKTNLQSQYSQTVDSATETTVETGKVMQSYIDVLEQTNYFDLHPEYEKASQDYQRELAEYTQALERYNPEYTWFGTLKNPEAYPNLLREYDESLAAYDVMLSLYQAQVS